MTCSEPECEARINDKIKGHHDTLYGKDNMGGLVKEQIAQKICSKSKVSNVKFYSTLGSILIMIVIIATPFINRGMDAFSEGKEKLHKVEVQQKSAQMQMKQIQADLKDVKKDVRELKTTQLTKEQLIAIIKEALR